MLCFYIYGAVVSIATDADSACAEVRVSSHGQLLQLPVGL